MNIQIGDTVRWIKHKNHEAIVVDKYDNIVVLNVYKPRRFEMRLDVHEVEVIPVDEIEIKLKDDDYKLLNEILLDISLLTRDKALFEECTKNK